MISGFCAVSAGLERSDAASAETGQVYEQVPHLVGQDQQTATSTLQNAGFHVQLIMVPVSDSSRNGIVVDEEPSGGTRAPEGSTVTIYVGSSG